MSKYHKKVLRKQGECIFGNENPSASGALRWALDPWPGSACFAHATSLRYVGNICQKKFGAPP